MKRDFQMDVRSFAHGKILGLKGDLTRQAEEKLLGLLQADSAASGAENLILDFTDVDYINSMGIAVLIRFARPSQANGFRIYAHAVSDHYRKLFRMVGLTEYILIYPSEYAIIKKIEELES